MALAHAFEFEHIKPRHQTIWEFPLMGVPPIGWFMRENPIQMDDFKVISFMETSISIREKSKLQDIFKCYFHLSDSSEKNQKKQAGDHGDHIVKLPGKIGLCQDTHQAAVLP